MTSISLERIADTFFQGDQRHDTTCYGRVDSINADGSFQVQLNASATKTRCANLCGATVNDRVLVLIQANGHCAAIGRVGGSMGAIPAVLYDNPSGYNGNITLEKSVADYDYIRVYFFISRDGTVTYASTDVYEPNGKIVSLFGARNAAYNSRFHYGGATYSISNSTMTLVSSGVADSSGSVSGDWNTYIYRVEAWSGGASIGFGGGSGGGGGGGGVGSQIDLLWTNPNPTSNFAAQTLSGIPWQDYKFLFIDHYTAGNGNIAAHYETSIISTDNPSDWSWITCIREVPFGRGVKFPASNQVQFGSQTYYSTYNGENATIYDDWPFIIPTKIWGVKQGGASGTATDVLYADDSGTTGTVTLSKSAANYDHMRIYFRYIDDDFYGSVDVYSPNGKTVQLSVSETTSWNGWLIGRAVVISGTSITTHNGNNYGEGKVNGDAEWNNVNKIAITRVEAWNDGGGAIADYVIETGETDGWHWEKWYSGKAEAWATKTHSVTINENYGNGWYSSEQHDDIPSGIFTSMEAVMLSGYGDGVGFAIEYGGGLTTTRTYSYWLMRVEGSAQPSTAYISIMAKGRWK